MRNNNFGDIVINAIVVALCLEKSSSNVKISLEENHISDEVAKSIAKSPNVWSTPDNHGKNLFSKLITHRGPKFITSILSTGVCPEKLRLSFNFVDTIYSFETFNNYLTEKPPYEQIGDEILSGISAALISGNCPKALAIYLDHSFSNKSIRVFAAAIASGKCPDVLAVSFYGCGLDDAQTEIIAQGLAAGKYPQKFKLKLRENKITDKGITAIAKALTTGNGQSPLKIDLSFNPFGTDGIKALAVALQSGNCPQNLSLILEHIDMREGVISLVHALASGKCPLGLKINTISLEDLYELINLGLKEIQALANALTSGNCPINLNLSLMIKSNVFFECYRAIANALISEKCPKGLHLALYMGEYDQAQCFQVTEIIAQALTSGKCPQALTIDLDYLTSTISPITRALATGMYPDELALKLNFNNIFNIAVANSENIDSLVTALASPQCSKPLYLDIDLGHLKIDKLKKLIEAFITGLHSNSTVIINFKTAEKTEIYLNTSSEGLMLLKLIHRNKLIKNYPEFENHIKLAFYKHSLYKPHFNLFQPKSLKEAAGRLVRFNFLNTQLPKKYPPDLIEYLNQFDKIDEEIQKIIPEYLPVRQKRKLIEEQSEQSEQPLKIRARANSPC